MRCNRGGAEMVGYFRMAGWESEDAVVLWDGRRELSVSILQCSPLQSTMATLLEQGEPFLVGAHRDPLFSTEFTVVFILMQSRNTIP